MKHTLLLPVVLVAILLPLSCKKDDGSPVSKKEHRSVNVTDEAKIKMLNSLEELDKDRLYTMNYTVDYKLQEVLDANVKSVDSLTALLSRLLFDRQPDKVKAPEFSSGCSVYAAGLAGASDFLLGRNYDYCHKEGGKEVETSAIVLFTSPAGGKKSINFVDAYWLQFQKGFYSDESIDVSNLMFAPYVICDGMNEDGLSISVLHLDGSPAEQNGKGKPDIYSSVAMRAVLDKYGTVDDACDFLKSCNMHMTTPAKGSLHFMLADAQGKHAIVEWSFADPMHVDSLSVPDFYIEERNLNYVTNFYVDPRLGYCIFGGLSNHGRDRYNTMRDTLGFYKNKLTLKQSKDLLRSVSTDPNPTQPTSHTQWSNIYNLSKRTVETAILKEYDRWYQFNLK